MPARVEYIDIAWMTASLRAGKTQPSVYFRKVRGFQFGGNGATLGGCQRMSAWRQ